MSPLEKRRPLLLRSASENATNSCCLSSNELEPTFWQLMSPSALGESSCRCAQAVKLSHKAHFAWFVLQGKHLHDLWYARHPRIEREYAEANHYTRDKVYEQRVLSAMQGALGVTVGALLWQDATLTLLVHD